jgi:DNA modification methylase
VLHRVLADGVLHGDAEHLLDQLPRQSVDLFFTSPPYADARAYSRIHPDRYVEWFLPFARSMYEAAKPSGSLSRRGAGLSDRGRPCAAKVLARIDLRNL